MSDRSVTLVITCCGRLDLLQRTLVSFFQFNTYPITECIIIEDSGTVTDLQSISPFIPVRHKFIINEENIGQIRSIDIAYAQVRTPYIFHCEEDWEFYDRGFIEESFKILDADRTVFTVWLRNHKATNGHPIEPEVIERGIARYHYMQTGFRMFWHGFTFNPGLRRTVDCMKLHPYAALKVLVKSDRKSTIGEIDLSVYYHHLGYRAAMTTVNTGFVKHIGRGRHIQLPWE